MDALLERLLEADRLLRVFQRAVEENFQRLRGNPQDLSFLGSLKEISQQARAMAGPNPTARAFEVLDEAADLVWAGPAEELFEFYAICPAVNQALWEYLGRAGERLQETGQRLWLRRALAVTALSRGGSDYRDLTLSLGHLARVARLWELPVGEEFQRIGELTSGVPGGGGIQGSIGDFLKRFP